MIQRDSLKQNPEKNTEKPFISYSFLTWGMDEQLPLKLKFRHCQEIASVVLSVVKEKEVLEY